jgi:acetylornithine deacetylase/succinyl-diaminopimelate desuccinylase-like protein
MQFTHQLRLWFLDHDRWHPKAVRVAQPSLARVVTLCLACCLVAATAGAAEPEDRTDSQKRLAELQQDAVELLSSYLRIDTTNPPGNEIRGAEFFARIFEREGIPYEIAESAPGRGNIWARLEATVDSDPLPAIVLLHHIDVVPANADYWSEGPFSGVERDGFLYGRGALDTKGLGILHLQAFLSLHHSERPRSRDVIFMATADEEAGGMFGAGWLIENRPELFEGVGLLLNEGGGGMLMGEQPVFSVEVTQKVPLWLRLTTRGTPGHGSSPRFRTAVTRMIDALDRLVAHEFRPRVVPEVRRYFEGLARIHPRYQLAFQNIESSVEDRKFLAQLQSENPPLHALLRNTCSITRLEGSAKINVVPAEAHAELDCRLLPDQSPDQFLLQLRSVMREPSLEIETLMSFTPATSSTDSELYRIIEATCREHFPNAVVLPSVVGGFTDSHFFRDLGITSYGFRPSLLPVSEAAGVHGNNERIAVSDIELGVAMMVDIVDQLTTVTQ